ncbi:tape measure domain-containing protein [Chryseobacterium oranimense]|uniref:Tape measure domain-containing protein n=1 Tax=Chryseobacterium oranimense TaxID=421058 RepID=A0A1M5X8E1_9FLAO|nr:tape measure protein [Chryseobacterium oranimense]SHH95912.1 tape measure domain-containing protein [Chryseobacterium oranimense]
MGSNDVLAVIQARKSVDELRLIEAEGKKVVKMFKDMVTQSNLINRSLNTGRLREFNAALQELNSTTQQHATLERQLAAALERTARLEHQQAQLATEQARTRREVSRATTEESRARQQLAREAQQEARQTRDSNSVHAQFTRQVREARDRAREYGTQIRNLREGVRAGTVSAREYSQQYPELVRRFREARNEGIRLQRQLNNINQSTLPASQRFGALKGRIMDIVKALGLVNVAQNVAGYFYQMGEKAYETSKKLDTLRLSQKTVFETNDEVYKQNDFLTKTAERYGIEILGLSDAYTKFAASAKDTYLEGQRSQTIFDAVTRSSALLGVNTEDTTGILRALGQMMSKGKVQAEELRGQLGDRMAGAFKLFADGMGVSTAQLDKMLKDGEVLADDVLPKFAEQLNKKYSLGIGEEIQTQAAATNRAANAWVAFVDGIEQGSGAISKSVISVSTAFTRMLEMLTPNKEVTIIEKEQAELNMLGYELKKNFNDEKKRKEILEEITKINPFFLNGLDKENLTLESIGNQLRIVNEQYVQKIALEKAGEKIKELVEDQAQAYIYLNKVFSENIVVYNGMNEVTKKTLEDFKNGSIGYWDALAKINKNTKAFTKENDTARDMLNQMNSIIAQGTLNFDGFNRGIDGNRIAIKNATAEYNSLVNMFDKMLGKQKQLVFMNGLTSKSFDGMGKEQINRFKEANEIIQQATLKGEKFALVRNVWRAQNAKGGWFTTNKKADDWFLEDGMLKKREKSKGIEKVEKPKPYTGAKLDGYQKDKMNTLQAERDTSIAYLTQQQNEGLINEQQFQEKRIEIIKGYTAKVQAYLKGTNAKEKQVEGAAILKASSEIKSSLKEQYDYFQKEAENTFQMSQNIFERQATALENDDYLTNTERLDKQIELDGKILESTTQFYEDQIALAKRLNQDVLSVERKRDEEIGKIQDARSEKIRSKIEARIKDLETESANATFKENVTFEEQKRLILSSKKLSNEEKTYRISLLEIDNQIKQNNLKIAELKALKAEYDLKVAMADLQGQKSPEFANKSLEAENQIKSLETNNTELNNDAKNLVSEKTQALRDAVTQGFKTIGFEQLADAYSATMIRLKNDTASWKDYAVLAATAVLESLSKLNEKQKEKTLANLDEQLKYSQETADQETEFINGRLEQLNALEDLTTEQMDERSRLEAEAMVVKEQQRQREKLIETQKAKAEQKAAAQQALINGALGATTSLAQYGFNPAGIIAAALALAFGVAQSVSIMSKDPTPKYWKGRQRGPAEWAWRDEQGAELHTDKYDRIKSFGSNSGAKLTWLDEGDKIYTANQTKDILKTMGPNTKIGHRLIKKSIQQSLQVPYVNIINKTEDNSEKISRLIAKEVRKAQRDLGTTSIRKENGRIIKERPGYVSRVVGTYDLKTGEETWI